MNDDILYCFDLEDDSESFDLAPELLAGLELDFSSYENREEGTFIHTVYALTREAAEENLARVREYLPQWLDFGAELELGKLYELNKADWAEAWKKFFKPLEISDTLIVRPSWEEISAKPGQAVLTIDPGMSFGTGQHATTLYCLKVIDRLAGTPGVTSMLDAGSGSGILAIAAGLRGYEKIDAFDFDPDAVRVSKENIAMNGLTNIHPEVGNAENYAGDPAKYDLVCANILGHLLKAYSQNIVTWVKPGKYLALAGILNAEFDGVSDVFTALGFKEIERFTLKEWTSGLFRKEV
ncbi:MAG: 50S ribosomal protein L11 methyltransferase [Lentisphaeria bacterium]|nr:50S ribosomal protein L11 methyltransferase [Lentisphaeria bacterium]